MTFQERINEIEALLNQYKENGFTSEEIEAVKEKVNTIKNDYDSGVFNEKKADENLTDTEIVEDSANYDEAAESLLEKYGVSYKRKEKASSSSDEYSDQLLEKLTAKTHVSSPGGQRESRRF